MHRKRAFEEHYKHDSPLPNGDKLNCSIIEGIYIYPFRIKNMPTYYPDAILNQQDHCKLQEGNDTFYSPSSRVGENVEKAEHNLEDAVVRYAEDNLLVVRVRFFFLLFNICPELSIQVFLKDPYFFWNMVNLFGKCCIFFKGCIF